MSRFYILALSLPLTIAQVATNGPPPVPPFGATTEIGPPSPPVAATSTSIDTNLAPSSASQYYSSSSLSVSKASVSRASARSTRSAEDSSTSSMADSSPSPAASSLGSQASSTSTDNEAQTSSQSQTVTSTQLKIILSVVLGVLVIVLLLLTLFLIRRYRRGATPFSRFSKRGATPINDDEIATWRGEKFRKSTVLLTQGSYTGDSPQSWQYPKPSSRVMGGAGIAQPVIARAPNSRTGLTDETIPGAAPFIPPLKRQSSRLSKLPAHQRNKSRRSSASNSIRSPIEPAAMHWFDPDDASVQQHIRDYSKGSKGSRSNSVAKVSIDGFTALSPRPRSSSNASHQPLRGNSGSLGSIAAAYASLQSDELRPEEIGRAYGF